MKRVLLIGDDINMSEQIIKILERNNNKTVLFSEASRVKDYISRNVSNIELVILDISPTIPSGIKTIKEIRQVSIEIPIITLSQDDKANTNVEVLNAGADDCIAKPIQEEEFIARMNSILKRTHKPLTGTIKIGDVLLDDEKITVRVNGSLLDLTSIEFKLLQLLMKNGEKVTKRNDILSEIWDVNGYEIMSNSIDVHINKLRKKLADKGVSDFIKTQRGFGYKIEL